MTRAGSRGNAYRNGGGGTCECGGDRPARRGIRADAPARPRRGAMRSWRHADVQGRDLRRARGDPSRRSLPARAPASARGHPRPVQPGRAGRRGDGRERADQARRDRPGGRGPVPAHAHRLRAHRGERRLLRPHRARAGDPAPPGGGGHPHRAARLLGRRRCGRHRRPRRSRGLRGDRPAGQRGLPGAGRDHAGCARRDRGDRQPGRGADRRAHRIRRPRLADQRPAPRPDDRHCRQTGSGQSPCS